MHSTITTDGDTRDATIFHRLEVSIVRYKVGQEQRAADMAQDVASQIGMDPDEVTKLRDDILIREQTA